MQSQKSRKRPRMFPESEDGYEMVSGLLLTQEKLKAEVSCEFDDNNPLVSQGLIKCVC